jgi:hypothetical protein
MQVRFQADADPDGRIIRGIRRAFPEIEMRPAAAAGLAGLTDGQVLENAALSGRVLVSQDRRTMPGHFARFVQSHKSPGVMILREGTVIPVAISGDHPHLECQRAAGTG